MFPVTSLVSPSVLVAKDRFFTRKPVFVFIFTGLRHCNHLRANCMKSGRCSRHSRRLASRNLHCFFLAMYMSALISYCICESDSHDSVKASDQFESCWAYVRTHISLNTLRTQSWVLKLRTVVLPLIISQSLPDHHQLRVALIWYDKILFLWSIELLFDLIILDRSRSLGYC